MHHASCIMHHTSCFVFILLLQQKARNNSIPNPSHITTNLLQTLHLVIYPGTHGTHTTPFYSILFNTTMHMQFPAKH